MIDYYLHKKCSLCSPIAKQNISVRCGGCICLDKKLNKCLFSLDYPKSIDIKEVIRRIKLVDDKQQNKLSQTFQMFILK